MKRTNLFVRGVFAAALIAGTLVVEGTQPVTVAQWDFNQGDLRATAGTAMEYRGDTEDHTAFVTAEINGSQGRVMGFPEADASQGFIVTHGAQPNGGGTKVNQYTLIFDLMYPAASGGWRALFQTA